MTQRWLAPICAVLALGIGSGMARGQAVNKMVVAFSTEPDKVAGNLADLEMRPNYGQTLYLFITNNSANTRETDITITDGDGKKTYATTKQSIKEAGRVGPVRITFAKPPATPPPAGAPAVPPMPMPMPMGPPVPPGIELASKYDNKKFRSEFSLKVHVEYVDNEMKTIKEDTTYSISVRQPTDYVKKEKVAYRNKKDVGNQLTLDFKSEAFPGGPACPVELVFPPQTGLNVGRLGEGVYKRTLTADPKPVRLYSKNLPYIGTTGTKARVYVNIDGVPRAYVYRPNLYTETEVGKEETIVDPQDKPEIRFMEAAKLEVAETIYSRPGIVPIRVEADAAPQGAIIQLKVRRKPGDEVVDTIVKEGVRQDQIWFEPAGPDGSMLITTKVGDWVIPLDVRDYRGRYELLAQLIDPADKDAPDDKKPSMPATLIVDDTRPEIRSITVQPENLKKVNPPEHVRTVPLPVEIRAVDPESGIAKVVVFLGKAPPDGKLPETAVEATLPKGGGDVWLAQLPLPMGAKGLQEVTAVVVNNVGILEVSSQKVQLIEPPLGGTIRGTVSMTPGGKVLNGVTVKLLDGEGKEKASATTDEKKNGVFEMKDVPPGTYKVVAGKPDSGVGTKGAETVTVKAGEVSKVRITLGRKPNP
jgi:Carboxypeptidase regulatory-like domain